MTMTLVKTVTVGAGGASTISFNDIPQTGTDILIKCSIRYSTGGQVATTTWIQFNGLTTNQSSRMLAADFSTGNAASYTDSKIFGMSNGSGSTASVFSNTDFYIPDYAGSTAKSISIDGVMENSATSSGIEIVAARWNSTAAITSLTLREYNGSYTMAEGSSASLYLITKGSGKATVS